MCYYYVMTNDYLIIQQDNDLHLISFALHLLMIYGLIQL